MKNKSDTKMINNTKILEKISIVDTASQLKLKPELETILGEDLYRKASQNSKKVNVYKIVYKSRGHKVMGFLVEPKNIKGKLPCIIWNRGGSKDFASIKMGQLFLNLAEFAKNDYMVITSNYSGSTGSEGEDEFGGEDLYDVLNLYKILKGHPNADIKRIGMYGWSRGGLMTYLCLAKVRWIKTAIVGAAPTDEVSAPKFRKGWREHQIAMYGGSRKEQIKRSAIYWANRFSKKTPILIMHGTADWRVNPLDSMRIAEKLFVNKIPFRLEIFEGGDHGLTEYKEEVEEKVYEWFDKYLKRGEEWPSLKPHGK